jgi:hypothetical protein
MQVLIEPVPGGVRARSGAPFDASEEAPTEEEAVARLVGAVTQRLHGGARIVEIPVAAARSNPWLAVAGVFADDPLFDEWQAAIREYRRERDAEDGPW